MEVMGNLRVRRMREQLNAVAEYVGHLRAPITEGYRDAPGIVEPLLDDVVKAVDELDRSLAKIDGVKGAVGGEVKLEERWASSGEVPDA